METRTEVSAGGIVFRRETDELEVALILTHEGRWQLPKGWVEEGEPHETTAVREVREEAGLDASIVGPIDTIEYWYTSTYEPVPARIHKYVHFYLLRYESGSTADHDDEVQEARWFPLDEAVNRLAFDGERKIMELARVALRKREDG